MTAEKIGDQCIAKMIVTFHRNRGRANRLQQEILRGRLYLIEDLLLSKRVKEFGLYHQSSHEAKAIREQALATLVSINLSKIQVNFQKNKNLCNRRPDASLRRRSFLSQLSMMKTVLFPRPS